MTEAAANPRAPQRYSLIAIVVCIGVYAFVQAIAYTEIGAFEYPLDDVYIHLAVAEQIATGGYGVNRGEYSSAASSPLYPFLLTPLARSSFHAWLPAFWNLLAMVLAAGLWGKIVSCAVSDRRWAVVLAAIGPLAFNLPGSTFVGMEHTIHLLLGIAVLRGLQIKFEEGYISWLLIAGMLLGPMIRFEGLAVTGGAALVLALTGRWVLGSILFTGATFLIAAFAVFLIYLGLEPLPNSVIAKLTLSGQEKHSMLSSIPVKLLVNLFSDKAIALLLAVFLSVGVMVITPRSSRIMRACLTAAIFVGIGHLILGKFGWFNRYELYAINFVIGMLILALFRTQGLTREKLALLGILLYLSASYTSILIKDGRYAPAGIYSQQRNMSRFVSEVYKKPVAVNDLGYVAWNNSDYVLDLWGLASYRALRTRLDNPYDGWAGDLMKERGVELAMIYDKWIKEGIGKDWIKVGQLQYTGDAAFLGDFDVSFYATNELAAQAIRAQLDEFKPTVEGKARLVTFPEGH